MKVTVIGTGNMGSAFVKQLAKAGHHVRVTGRDLAKAQALATGVATVTVAPPATALADSDVIIVATGYADAVPALRALGDLRGKVVVDISNPLTADYMGLTLGHSTSAAEEIAAAIPGAHVVKAFNTIFAPVLAAGASVDGQQVPVFVAADSAPAKDAARQLAQSLGFAVIDAGGLKNARYLEPLAGLNIVLGYGAGLGTSIAPTWLRQS